MCEMMKFYQSVGYSERGVYPKVKALVHYLYAEGHPAFDFDDPDHFEYYSVMEVMEDWHHMGDSQRIKLVRAFHGTTTPACAAPPPPPPRPPTHGAVASVAVSSRQ